MRVLSSCHVFRVGLQKKLRDIYATDVPHPQILNVAPNSPKECAVMRDRPRYGTDPVTKLKKCLSEHACDPDGGKECDKYQQACEALKKQLQTPIQGLLK